jgi:hypothetical protein
MFLVKSEGRRLLMTVGLAEKSLGICPSLQKHGGPALADAPEHVRSTAAVFSPTFNLPGPPDFGPGFPGSRPLSFS